MKINSYQATSDLSNYSVLTLPLQLLYGLRDKDFETWRTTLDESSELFKVAWSSAKFQLMFQSVEGDHSELAKSLS